MLQVLHSLISRCGTDLNVLALIGRVSWLEVAVVWTGLLVTLLIGVDSAVRKIPWRDRYVPTDSVKWYFLSYFVWIVALPMYLLRRRKTLKNRHIDS